MICCLALRGLQFQIRQLAISALFSEASSGDDDYTDPKATVSIARPRVPKASHLDGQNVAILCIPFLLVSECSEAVCNCSELCCCMSRIARSRNTNRKMLSFHSILETRGVKSEFSSQENKACRGEQEKARFSSSRTPKMSCILEKSGKFCKDRESFFGGKSCIFAGNWAKKVSSRILW